MDAPLALYRRYRPDSFEDVIGQDHVTQPLSNALDNNRVHHAYLFSGPRGCGKTTSARIMARALNCEKGPTSTPCGSCESCVELATGGPGSIDVIEIDAASHGGVDDTRDLREKAMFGPMKARYKVYIIDEAHMVSTQGFNALLKLVEEPPAHLRFIFATTEPDKVIGTIKSRTHHYPFRLVPPKVLGDYVLELCRREGVTIEPTVVPLVVRAGGGSVRDSLSVLDQLIGGSGSDGVTYSLATALLGYTPDSLLDETVDALAADDGATVFGVVDKVIESGQDPRRFAEDLLQRLRDLVVVAAVPDAAPRGLLDIPDDQADRLAGQSARLGRAALTRAADIVSAGLTEMRGATAPRLLLEMMCARILLPGIDDTAEGLGARIERIERRLSVVGDAAGTSTGPPSPSAPVPSPESPPESPKTEPSRRARSSGASSGRSKAAAVEPPEQVADTAPAESSVEAEPESSSHSVETPAGARQSDDGGSTAREATAPGQLGLVDVRRLWPGVLERVKAKKKYAWMLLSQNAQVKDLEGNILTIAFAGPGPCKNFQSGDASRVLQEALVEELGVAWQVEAIIDGATTVGAGGGPRAAGSPAGTSTGAPAGGESDRLGSSPVAASGAEGGIGPNGSHDGSTTGASQGGPSDSAAVVGEAAGGGSTATATVGRGKAQGNGSDAELSAGAERAGAGTLPGVEEIQAGGGDGPIASAAADQPEGGRAAAGPSREGRDPNGGAGGRSEEGARPAATPAPTQGSADDSLPRADDEVVDDPALTSQELLARELGAHLIDEKPTS